MPLLLEPHPWQRLHRPQTDDPKPYLSLLQQTVHPAPGLIVPSTEPFPTGSEQARLDFALGLLSMLSIREADVASRYSVHHEQELCC